MNGDLIQQIKTHLIAQGYAFSFPPATEDTIEKTEQKIGLSLPPLLRTIYLQIGNGGFGPGLGIIGVEGGYLSDFGDLADTYLRLRNDEAQWDQLVLPFCEWGSNIFACVRCESSFQVSISEDCRLWPKSYNLTRFFELWLEGTDILSYDSTFEEHVREFPNQFTGRKQKRTTKRRRS
jgi:hypothetical protein